MIKRLPGAKRKKKKQRSTEFSQLIVKPNKHNPIKLKRGIEWKITRKIAEIPTKTVTKIEGGTT